MLQTVTAAVASLLATSLLIKATRVENNQKKISSNDDCEEEEKGKRMVKDSSMTYLNRHQGHSKERPFQLVLVRHAESENNVTSHAVSKSMKEKEADSAQSLHKYADEYDAKRIPDPGLSPLGQAQALALVSVRSDGGMLCAYCVFICSRIIEPWGFCRGWRWE